MARRRSSPSDPPTTETVVQLRLQNRRPADWAFGAEGFLTVFDPEVVTERVFEELVGLQTIAPATLFWMSGNLHGPAGVAPVAERQHWPHPDRAEVGRRVARLVQLGWERALMMLPFTVGSNGMDVRFTAAPLTEPERREQQAAGRKQRGRTTAAEPRVGWVTARGPRLGVTWDWLLGFTPRQKAQSFGPGYQVEFPWPAGDYQAKAWGFEATEDDDGQLVDRVVVQLVRLPPETDPAPDPAHG